MWIPNCSRALGRPPDQTEKRRPPTEDYIVLYRAGSGSDHQPGGGCHAQGVLRPDLAFTDLSAIFEQLSTIRLGDEARTAELRRRYLALHLEGMRSPGNAPLPGTAPLEEEQGRRWQPREVDP